MLWSMSGKMETGFLATNAERACTQIMHLIPIYNRTRNLLILLKLKGPKIWRLSHCFVVVNVRLSIIGPQVEPWCVHRASQVIGDSAGARTSRVFAGFDSAPVRRVSRAGLSAS